MSEGDDDGGDAVVVVPDDWRCLPPSVTSSPPLDRCHCNDDASNNTPSMPSLSTSKSSNNNMPHHKQLYFWNTHFSPKLLPSITRILRDEGPAGTVRILSCSGLVAEAISIVLQSAARVSMLVLSGLSNQDSHKTMKALRQSIDGWEEEYSPAFTTPVPHCRGCRRQSSSLRTLRILETSFGSNGDNNENDNVSLSLFDFLGHPSCGIRELDLSKSKLSPGAARSLANALSKNTGIRILKLNHVEFIVGGNLARAPVDDDIDLSRNSEHSRAGFEPSQQTTSSCPLATILRACIVHTKNQAPSRLKELHLSHILSVGTEAMVALCQLLPALEMLDLNGSQWSDTAISLLIDTLTGINSRSNGDRTFHLKQLILTGIPLTESNIAQLCHALEHPVTGPLQQLEMLELQHCQLTETALLVMMQSLPRWSPSLHRLDLARNFLRPTIVDRLLQAVEQNYTLHDLGRPLLLHDKTQQSQHELLEFYLDCNWAGRRLFRRSNNGRHHDHKRPSVNQKKVPPGLWPYLLARINQKPIRRTRNHYSHDGPGRRESLLFALLRGRLFWNFINMCGV